MFRVPPGSCGPRLWGQVSSGGVLGGGLIPLLPRLGLDEHAARLEAGASSSAFRRSARSCAWIRTTIRSRLTTCSSRRASSDPSRASRARVRRCSSQGRRRGTRTRPYSRRWGLPVAKRGNPNGGGDSVVPRGRPASLRSAKVLKTRNRPLQHSISERSATTGVHDPTAQVIERDSAGKRTRRWAVQWQEHR